jgi:hypothetical protein
MQFHKLCSRRRNHRRSVPGSATRSPPCTTRAACSSGIASEYSAYKALPTPPTRSWSGGTAGNGRAGCRWWCAWHRAPVSTGIHGRPQPSDHRQGNIVAATPGHWRRQRRPCPRPGSWHNYNHRDAKEPTGVTAQRLAPSEPSLLTCQFLLKIRSPAWEALPDDWLEIGTSPMQFIFAPNPNPLNKSFRSPPGFLLLAQYN